MKEGLERIFSNIPEDMPVVGESNAVRLELKPSLFLVLKDSPNYFGGNVINGRSLSTFQYESILVKGRASAKVNL